MRSKKELMDHIDESGERQRDIIVFEVLVDIRDALVRSALATEEANRLM